MRGKIIKGIAGFYYVHVVESGVFECKAKGIFRKDNIKPMVGDEVEIEVLDEEARIGNISVLYDRRSELLRPAVSNVDQSLVIFAVKKPETNFNLLDRFLLRMEYEGIPTVVCFNKADLANKEEMNSLKRIYESAGYKVLFVSTFTGEGMDELRNILKNKTTTVAGPSGVGKSSIVNILQKNVVMETGRISEKIERGRHTTRHSEIIPIEENTYIVDTPGFSSIYLTEFDKETLKDFYPEYVRFNNSCRFNGCNHISEPDCLIKEAVEKGEISKIRYDNYCLFFDELKNKKIDYSNKGNKKER